MGELVKALLDLFTQAVDHVFHILMVGGGRSYTPGELSTGPAMRARSAYFQSRAPEARTARLRPTATLRARRTIRRGFPKPPH